MGTQWELKHTKTIPSLLEVSVTANSYSK